MRKILILLVCLVTTCLYGATPLARLSASKEAVLHLGRTVAHAKLAAIGGYAVDCLHVDPDKANNVLAIVRGAFPLGHAALIDTVEVLDLEGRSSLMSSKRFIDGIKYAMKALPLAPAIPEDVETAGLVLQQLHRLFTEQTVVSGEHVAPLMQVVAEMQTLSDGWGPLVIPDEVQASEWHQLVSRLAAEVITMVNGLPDAFANYRQRVEPLFGHGIFGDPHDTDNLVSDDLTNIAMATTVLESYQHVEALLKLYRSDKVETTNMTVLEGLAQTYRGYENIIYEVANMEVEHFNLLSSYLTEQISGRAFVQQYLQFLEKHQQRIPGETRMAVSLQLANFF